MNDHAEGTMVFMQETGARLEKSPGMPAGYGALGEVVLGGTINEDLGEARDVEGAKKKGETSPACPPCSEVGGS